MTFREKIDKILEDNELGITSVSGLEDAVTATRSSINRFYKSNRDPGRKTLKKILALPGLNKTWWETGKGDVFCNVSVEKHTHAQNQPAITGNPDMKTNFTTSDLTQINIQTLVHASDGLRADIAGLRAELAEVKKERDELRKQLTQLTAKGTAPANNIQE